VPETGTVISKKKMVRNFECGGTMFRRALVILLVGGLLTTLFGLRPVYVSAKEKSQSVEIIRAQIARLGVGKEARVKIKLRDNTKLEGYINQTSEDSFTILDSKTGASRIVAYSEVTQVSKQGNGLSTMTKVVLGAAIATGVVVGWLILKPAVCDGGAQTRGIC
jgi:hypothetical protein